MKLILTTTYTNIDEEWLTWWIARAGMNYGFDVKNPKFPHVMKSKDPTSDVVGETKIELLEADFYCFVCGKERDGVHACGAE